MKFNFPQIDVLRCFAALSVVVYHVIEHFGWSSFPASGLLLWFRVGWMGVDLFFVISGFVIALAAFAMIDRAQEANFRYAFMKRRVRRILPLHYLTCLIFIALSMPVLFWTDDFWGNLIAHGLFVHNVDRNWHGAINGPNWSVAVEMQFYLTIALLAPVMRDCRWWIIPLVAFPLAWTWRYSAFLYMPIHEVLGPYPRFWLVTQLPGVADQFAIGVLLARFMRSNHGEKLLSTSTLFAPFTIAGALMAVWVTMLVFWPRAGFWDHAGMVTFWRTLESIAWGFVILAACLLGAPRLVMLTAPLRYLGTISYGIYLWHLPVLLAVKEIEWMEPHRALPVVLALTIVLAAGSWHFFEQQFLKSRC